MDTKNKNIVVSVSMITYNHEKFIAQAIEGVLMQETDFPIELIIGEDCSTDNTRKICLEYKEKYPEIIKLLLPEKNIGMHQNFITTLQACTGKYIALCEGDDYWTDPLKLQKQVDFLEANGDYSMCFHNVHILGKHLNVYQHLQQREYSVDEILLIWTIPTCSAVIHRNCVNSLPQNENFVVGDNIIFTSCGSSGKIYCINEKMGVYRMHAGGVSNQITVIPEKWVTHYETMRKYFPKVKQKTFDTLIISNYVTLSKMQVHTLNISFFHTFWEAFTKYNFKYIKELIIQFIKSNKTIQLKG
jgi:glycosyltransferase involved in cell wall biosynthesis